VAAVGPARPVVDVTQAMQMDGHGCRAASWPMTTMPRVTSGWSRKFEEPIPIPLPNGRQLVTLQDAGTYITRLPKAEHSAPEWRAAMAALILVVERNGPTRMARIGVMKALITTSSAGSIPIARRSIGESGS
jgi:hypothetical protein